jgi:cell division septum initiation protein DivIVA
MQRTRDELATSTARFENTALFENTPPFETALRGFDRQQVMAHVNALKARVLSIGNERDAALQRLAELTEQFEQVQVEAAEAAGQVDYLRHEAAESAAELERLQRSPLTAATARIQRMLQMAEDEATELQARAEQEATSLLANARAEADRLRRETTQQCERLEAESQRRRQAMDAETAARCQQAEQQTEQDTARRRAETEAWVGDYQARGIAALHLIMKMAGERLNSRVAKAKQQVTAARTLRSEITGQLWEVHRLLAEALGVVDQPTPAEQAEQAEQAGQAGQVEPSDDSPPGADAPTERFTLHPW